MSTSERSRVRRSQTETFRHGKGRTNLAIKKREQPLILLLRRAVLRKNLCASIGKCGRKEADSQHTHVASIGSGAVHDLGCHLTTVTQHFRNDSILDTFVVSWLASECMSELTHLQVGKCNTMLRIV
jgi:hypothetical protein